MIVLQLHDFSHRLRNDGIMESSGDIGGDWHMRAPDSMSMTGAEYEYVRSVLRDIAARYPRMQALPSAEKQKQFVEVPEGVR